jgi:hypothetical protein
MNVIIEHHEDHSQVIIRDAGGINLHVFTFVTFENASETEPLVFLRYFGPAANPEAPELMAYQ